MKVGGDGASGVFCSPDDLRHAAECFPKPGTSVLWPMRGCPQTAFRTIFPSRRKRTARDSLSGHPAAKGKILALLRSRSECGQREMPKWPCSRIGSGTPCYDLTYFLLFGRRFG